MREGYIFTGWFMDSAATEPYDEIARENMTLYAGWKEEQFFLTKFDANGGLFSDGAEVREFSIKDGVDLDVDIPAREGYDFYGWYRDPAAETPYDGIASEDMTLYAGWNRVTYTAIFDANGGVFYNNDQRRGLLQQ